MCRVLRHFLKERELKYPVQRLDSELALDKADALIICGDPTILNEAGPMVPAFRLAPGNDDYLDKYKFQALRWINQEDDPLQFMHEHQNLELLAWLNAF